MARVWSPILMTTFNDPALLAGEEIKSEQVGWWTGMEEDFLYDLTSRADYESQKELEAIIDEVIGKDVYRLETFTQPGDVWVDAGCHVGIFSIAAMMHGADVSVMLDADNSVAWMAELNARGFLSQVVRRQIGKGHQRIRPSAFNYKVGSPVELVECGMMTPENWPGRRSCLKMDVQGAEVMVLALGGGDVLADGFDRLVMEWHRPDAHDVDTMLGDRWQVTGVQAHTDALLGTQTYIVWAETVDREAAVV